MPGMKRKKSRQSGRSTKRSKKSSTSRSIKAILYRALDTKKTAIGIQNTTNWNTSAGISWNIPYTLGLGFNGSGPNQRIGDKIHAMSLRVAGLFWSAPVVPTSTGDTAASTIYFRVLILAADEYVTTTSLGLPFRRDVITAASYVNNQFAPVMAPVDTDAYTVIKDKLVTFQPQLDTVNKTGHSQAFEINVNFNRDWQFKSGATSELKNKNYYLYIQAMSGASELVANIGEQSVPFQGNMYLTFKDA